MSKTNDIIENTVHTDGSGLGNELSSVINGYTPKTTPIDADAIPLLDSASAFSLKKVTFANLKTTLDALYSRTSAIFGIGQTWQDVSTSRSFGVTYTNNTGKPIQLGVSVANTGSVGGFGLFATIDGTDHIQIPAQTSGPGNMRAYLNIPVPDGSDYEITNINGNLPIWHELR